MLLVGALEDADLFLRALAQDRRQALRVIGLLALGSPQAGRRIQGQPILGSAAEAGAVLERLSAEGRVPQMLAVASPDISGPSLEALVREAERFGVTVRRAPRPTALHPAGPASPRLGPLELRPVAIEELLNRPQVPLDREGMARLIQGRRVMVTGAGGTIGSELARQLATLGPSQLLLIDNGEYALWQIDLELAESRPAVASAGHAGRCARRAARPFCIRGVAAGTGVPCRRAEACTDGGGEPVGGTADQRRRDAPCGGCRSCGGSGGDGADLHRQGGEPDIRDGCVQAAGGDVLSGARHLCLRRRPGACAA